MVQVGRFFQIVLAFPEYMNFIMNSFLRYTAVQNHPYSISRIILFTKDCKFREYQNTHIPRIARIMVFERTAIRENFVSGTVLVIQLMQNYPTCTYIGQNPRKWKSRYAGTRCSKVKT